MRLVLTGPVVRRRLAVCLAAFFVLFLVLTARLFYLQAIAAEDLQRRAQAQWTSDSVIAPTRGGIYDRNGTALALSATAYTASASPRQVKDAQAFARALAPVLDMEESEIVQKVSDTSKGGVTIKRQLTREAAQQVKTMMLADEESGADILSGLYLEEESRRYYPMGAFATQLLGLTTIDGVGQAGLESSLNDYLSGKEGSILEEIDGKGREVSYGAREYVPAVDGGSVTLTIDASIQSFAEKAAREAMAVNNAKSVRVLVMQPQTGEILALVCKPDYDLNDPPRDDVETLTQLMRNTVVSDAYEPGSTFKILTAAAALDAGVTSENEGFYCSGSIYVEGGRIRCWGEPHGAETMAEALENSCNPVFVELGLRLGIERFYDYMERFGIGSATGVDIPGEGSGIVIDESVVGRVDLARIGFGQSVAVTPIQLLTAACSVVNGGRLLKPYVVKEIRAEDGAVIERGRPWCAARPSPRRRPTPCGGFCKTSSPTAAAATPTSRATASAARPARRRCTWTGPSPRTNTSARFWASRPWTTRRSPSSSSSMRRTCRWTTAPPPPRPLRATCWNSRSSTSASPRRRTPSRSRKSRCRMLPACPSPKPSRR